MSYKPIVSTAKQSSTKYFLVFFGNLAKKILYINVESRAGFFLAYILLGSLICDFFTPPHSFLARKENYLNLYGVKIGWGWTMSLLLPIVCSTSYLLSNGSIQTTLRHSSRLIYATILWYFWTTLFLLVERNVGLCSLATGDSKLAYAICHARGGKWVGLDLSGHIFMLTYCQLIIGEECKLYQHWERTKNILMEQQTNAVSSSRSSVKMVALRRILVNNPWIDTFLRTNGLCLGFLSYVWELMIFATILYFHTTVQKFSAVLIAISCWYITYKWFYTTSDYNPLSPGKPESILSNMQ